jgi:hypothetical protein
MSSCFGGNMGAEYICPVPSIGGPINQRVTSKESCHGCPVSNMGRLSYFCHDSPNVTQKGGSQHPAKHQADPCQFNKERQYGQPELQGYRYDLYQVPVGKRPIHITHNNRDKLSPLEPCLQNTDRCFGCRQPQWTPQCM